MATNKPRYTVSVDDELFERIEDFRFTNRFPNRAEATVELIRRGLEAVKKENSPHGDYGKMRNMMDATRKEASLEGTPKKEKSE